MNYATIPAVSLLPLYRWADHSWVGSSIRASTYIFPVVEIFHLLGLTVLIGTVIVLTVRLFGWALSSQPVQEVARGALKWTWMGAVVTIVSGVLLFSSEALKCYASPPFTVKMILLLVALVLTYSLHRRLTRSEKPAAGAKFAAGLALALWFGVGLAGRAIAFF